MKSLTVWQIWCSLIIAGAKPYEFRFWDYRRRYPKVENQRIVLHASTRKINVKQLKDVVADPAGWGLRVDIARPILERALASPLAFPLAAGLGTAIIGTPRRVSELFGGEPTRDDRGRELWAWPMRDIEPFEPYIPCKGWQGFWNWPKGLPG